MSGGRIDVRGDAGANTGGAPAGAARGMTGGEIIVRGSVGDDAGARMRRGLLVVTGDGGRGTGKGMIAGRSEEHTSELQSPCNLVCRLLLEKKKRRTSISVQDTRLHAQRH